MADTSDSSERIPGGLPLLQADAAASDLGLGGEADFWADLDERAAGYGLGDDLDRALAGRASPRIWVLVHEPGHPQLAAAAALAFARALADRGQAALVLDGDDQATALTRWAGREDAEGWIDIVRYGTSVLTSGTSLPFAGRTAYLVGVGSYAPTDASDEEIDRLLTRLRRQADDVLVVVPGGRQAAPWARRADIRLLCHDRTVLSPQHLAAVVANLTEAGVAPTALVGFGPATAADPGPQAGPAADEPAPAAGAEDPVEPAGPAPAGEPEEAADDDSSVAGALAALEEQDERDEADAADERREEEYARRRGTSPVFWLVAVAAAVMIAAVGVYWFRFVRVPDGSLFGEAPTAALESRQPPATAAAPPSAPAPADSAGPGAVAAAADTAGAGLAAAPDTVAATTAPEAAPVAAPEPTPPEPARPVFDPDPYRAPVGAGGWALQVYSFRDSSSAAVERRRLDRLGLRSAVRIVELPDTGRWWRVYVGSFPTRRAARDAEPALFAKLRTDWARPTRFTVSEADTAGR